jgi:hypothetical protein
MNESDQRTHIFEAVPNDTVPVHDATAVVREERSI